MIKSWKIFNESVDGGEFTKEMAKEIMYYFSEDSQPNNDFSGIFEIIEQRGYSTREFIFYETGYDDINRMINYLYKIGGEDEVIKREGISTYQKIREERESFPHFYEIEERLSDFMDIYNFNFMIYSDSKSYKIKLHKKGVSFDDFIKYCHSVLKYSKLLESPDYKTYLGECNYLGGENVLWAEFAVIMELN
jgi:hypothetical protein